jgi:hypothetical protein
MTLPGYNPPCRSRAHCGTCRDLTAGRALRAQWLTIWPFEGLAVDFPCIEGHDWGYAGGKPPMQFPKFAMRVCQGCPSFRSCPSVKFCKSCGGGEQPRLAAPCPEGKWGVTEAVAP